MGTNSSPEYPWPGGTPGAEAPDPVAGKPGHFAWSRWIKQYVKNLNTNLMAHQDSTNPHPAWAAAIGVGGATAHKDLTGLTVGNDHTQYQLRSEKGAADGYAALDSGIKIPIAQLPTGTTASTVALGSHSHTLDDLSDVTTAGATVGQSLVFGGTGWGPATITGGTGGGGVTDHGMLDGLGDPDHPIAAVQGLQAALDGKASVTHGHALGDLPTTLATDVEVTAAVSAHNSSTTSHVALMGTAAPVRTEVDPAVIGTSYKYAREDHKHPTLTAAPVNLGVANAPGTSSALARADHVHKFPTATEVGAELPGAGAAAVAAHEGKTDPHSQYMMKSGVTDPTMVQKVAPVSYWWWAGSTGQGADWGRMAAAVPYQEFAICNPDSGVGAASNSDWVTRVQQAQAAGLKVYGYVQTDYAGTSQSDSHPLATPASIKAEVDKYYTWYNVDGIFYDESSWEAAKVPFYKDIYDYVKAKTGVRGKTVIINPGSYGIDEGYMATCDIIMTYENTAAGYLTTTFPAWMATYPRKRFWHAIHEVSSEAQADQILAKTVTNNAGYIYLTTSMFNPNPWDKLVAEPYWSKQVSHVSKTGTPDQVSGHTIQAADVPKPARGALNFAGAGVVVTDDAAGDKTTVTIAGGSGGSGTNQQIQDEGGVPLPYWPLLNFVGAGVSAVNDPAFTRTNILIPGGYSQIQKDGGTPFASWPLLNFTGTGVAVTNDAPFTRTTVDIQAGMSQAVADGRYLQNETADTMNGSLTVNGAVSVNAPAGTGQQFGLLAGGKVRWAIGRDNAAEGGANAGSNFAIARYADDGTTWLGNALTVNRATGAMALGGAVTVAAAPTVNLGIVNKQYADDALLLKAPLASPALTGVPTAPTAAAGTNTTQVATTEYVVARTPKITVGTTAPSSPAVGDIWVDTN